ncbi:MAG: sodium:proton antiporter [Planctomycetaceae bacterium]|nr:sodium:proton antiporter [Planctomycetaceae bacterium]
MTDVSALSYQEQQVSRRYALSLILAFILCLLGWQFLHTHQTHGETHHAEEVAAADNATEATEGAASHEGDEHEVPAPDFYSIIPFVALLLCIALLPLFHKTEHWWEHNWNRFIVAAGLGLVTLVYYTFLFHHGVVDHTTHQVSEPGFGTALVVLKNALLVEYIPFICLLFSLYVISGGIAIEGHLVGKPKLNAGLIGLGGLLASFIGTTGAAMLLIRPLLRANNNRDYVAHTVIFFIFVVCNTGGCLLPIGDPPLFLGYLRGVPFTWTLELWPEWLFVNCLLVVVYFCWDSLKYKKENKEKLEKKPENPEPFAIRGALNFVFLVGVIFCVALLDPSKTFPGTDWHAPVYFREVMMLILSGVSLVLTSISVREKNAFNYDAILEVAALFIGIFICMQAPIQILNVYGGQLGFDSPTKFYWGTGILSSFLDNAPTYVVFFETAKTVEPTGVLVAGVGEYMLAAISLGAVFMGAMTYIGNGPNFMVKAIAEKNNVRMPSFFGYMFYSCGVLLPISILMNIIFLR